MSNRVSGKVAVVTGSTGGVGEGIARLLAAEGAAVVVSGRRDAEGERVVADIIAAGGRAVFQRADVSQEADCLALIAAAKEHFGRIDILVNCAAALAHYDFDKITIEEWDETLNTNIRGPFLCSREAIRLMKEQGSGGSIVNIGTVYAYRGSADRIAYACSKGALLTMTKALASSFLRDRIRVNWIIVGWVASPQEIDLRDRTHGDGRTFLQESGEKRPLGRHETPEDIANGVLFLASDESTHVTGCEMNITGGIYF